jgi:hypothetical protein
MNRRLWLQRIRIFLELAPRRVKGGPDWWPQVKACWAEAREVQMEMLYGRFRPFVKRFVEAAKALNRACVTVGEAFQNTKRAFARLAPVLQEVWEKAKEESRNEKGCV